MSHHTQVRKPFINEQVRGRELRVLNTDGSFLGILSRDQALSKAKEAGLDLVLITPGDQPLCRIIEVGKYMYEQSKKKKHAPNHKEKELTLSVNIGEHDFDTKVRHAEEFLAKGHPVRLMLQFENREMAHPELGVQVVERFLERTKDHMKATPLKRAGNKIFVGMQPKTSK